jgi:hypothetical protein
MRADTGTMKSSVWPEHRPLCERERDRDIFKCFIMEIFGHIQKKTD